MTPSRMSAAPPRVGPAERRVAPRRLWGAGGPVPLWSLLCLQGAAALLLSGFAADSGALLVVAGVLAAGLVLLAVLWRGGQPLPVWATAAWALRRRRRRAAGPLPAGLDPLVALAVECQPGLRSHGFAGRTGRTVGMLSDGPTLTAVLRVQAPSRGDHSPLRPGPQEGALPLRPLYDALETDGIRLESVKCVQFTQPAPAPVLPPQVAASVNYQQLAGQGGPPGLRLSWVVLRFDSELCPAAVAERGGGLVGAQRCLARAADQLASRLAGAGFPASVLSEPELLAAVAAGVSSDQAVTALVRQQDGPRPRRTVETARAWRCDDRWHTTFRVARWPALGGPARLAGLVAMLTSTPALATTFAVTLRRGGRESAELSGHIRVTGRGDGELRVACRALVSAARGAGIGLVRMDRQQLPGLLATLPLGGDR